MNISTNSKNKGDTFVSLNNLYISDAIKNNYKKIIVNNKKFKTVKDTRKYLEHYLKKYYYKMIKDIILIGVTGTNGKTTTSYLIYQALNKANIKCAYIGTIGFYINNEIKELNNTTPDICDLYEMLLECKKNNVKVVVMEVSSHALKLGRVNTLKFDYAIFTNLSEDHLDFHKNIKDYYNSKMLLFKKMKRKGISIINSDFIVKSKNKIKFGINHKPHYKIENINKNKFILNDISYETKLIGKYNIFNLIPTIILLEKFKVNNINEIIKELTLPPGRFEIINYNTNKIIIDYAHTPDALQNVLDITKELNGNKIYTIIGCGGNREIEKRPIMGLIATKNSNLVIFTNDNPRYEDPKKIINDITNNLDCKYKVIYDRKKAIEYGIKKLKKNDILLILGKGHEKYQIIKDKKIYFSDIDTVNDIIKCTI